MDIKIKRIKAEETWPLRQKLLRPHQRIEEVIFSGDDEEHTLHLGAFVAEQYVGIVTFLKRSFPGAEDSAHWQLRGMATEELLRKKGVARELLRSGLKYVREKGGELIWCNARLAASGFYEKAGFEKKSEVFEIEGIGPHFVMSLKVSVFRDQ
ncbi:GNAT family N-acetyltransferase [Candidatus Riflebacteria bacterium]